MKLSGCWAVSRSIEARLVNLRMVLVSFIVSNTPHTQLLALRARKKELEARHVFFQNDDAGTYIKKALDRILLQET
jgi:hypothetical protein